MVHPSSAGDSGQSPTTDERAAEARSGQGDSDASDQAHDPPVPGDARPDTLLAWLSRPDGVGDIDLPIERSRVPEPPFDFDEFLD